jgi:hypothetical protein
MVMKSRDDRSELRKILDDSVKFDWDVEIEPTQPVPARKVVVGWRERLRTSKAPYRSHL